MNFALSYLGHSELQIEGDSAALRFAPNLARERVSFEGTILDPLRFREGISALHDVVVGDHRVAPKDRSAYEAWRQEQEQEQRQLHQQLLERNTQAELEALATEAIPAGLEEDFRRLHRKYWGIRVGWANELMRSDPELFRHLVPCDPVVSVAPDTVFFECFAKDESSYGCFYADRGAFRTAGEVSLGTTNVDYSIALYDHFQSLRTYRSTKLLVDPGGFDVKVQGQGSHREEKIDLPPSWLRGFGQIAAATGLPGRTVSLPVESVYSILVYLERHREKKGPRSIRFQLEPGRSPRIVLDPWEVEIAVHGPVYRGERAEEIKIWGRRRLGVLARTLPFAERIDVQLLGSGLPSIWTAHMGDMRFVLALSGWTTNDWSGGAALDQLAGQLHNDARTTDAVARALRTERRATLAELSTTTGGSREALLGSLHRLAKRGQVIYDFATGVYRWRSIMPAPLTDSILGPEPPELLAGRTLVNDTTISRDELLGNGRVLVVGRAGKTSCEAILDADHRFTRAKCSCRFFHKARLRGGPCRHLIALRLRHLDPLTPLTPLTPHAPKTTP